MRSRLAACFGFALAMAVVVPSAAQQNDVNSIVKRFDALYNAGNYAAALLEAQKLEAAVKARVGTDHSLYAIALSGLAQTYDAQGKYAEAEAVYRRAVAITERSSATA